MLQAAIDDEELRSMIEALNPDGVTVFTLGGPQGPSGGEARGVLVHGTRLVNQMRANHRLGPPETVLLGRAYLAAALMGATMKGEDSVSIRVSGDGPAEGFSVEGRSVGAGSAAGGAARDAALPGSAAAHGEAGGASQGAAMPGGGVAGGAPGVNVRGYLFRAPIPLERPLESSDLAPLVGQGSLSVTRFISGAPRPFTGTISLRSGRLAEDLAAYYLESEQTRTAFRLSVRLDAQGRAIGAGGLFLQALPGAGEDFIARAEAALIGLPSLGLWFAEGGTREGAVGSAFGELGAELREEREVRFACGCGRERFASFLAASKAEFLRELSEEGPWPVEAHCHNCGTTYAFGKDEIDGFLARREAAEKSPREEP